MFSNTTPYVTQSDDDGDDVFVSIDFETPTFTGESDADASPAAASGSDVENPVEADAASVNGKSSAKKKKKKDNRPSYQLRSSPPRTRQEKEGAAICCSIIVAVLVLLLVILLPMSFKKVDETEWGVQYKKYKKELDDAAVSGGLFTGPPGYEMIKFPSTFLTADFDERTCVSRDGLRIVFSASIQYQMQAEDVVPAILKYRNVFKWREIVEQGGLSAMHHACGDFFISDFQNKRGEIQERMLENLRLKLEGDPDEEDAEGVFAMAISVQLRNLELPGAYNTAVENKQAAEEDIALAIAQRKQETTKAETQLLKANEEARKILNTANNEADVLLTEANLKSNETTYAFEQEAQAIVEVKEALGLTTEGVLTHLANNLYAEVKNLKVVAGQPAKLGREDEL
ncbi:MAG: hypothetical protein SGARI_005303 [Bacillariaceae sp.]